jgi:hypothetical protein
LDTSLSPEYYENIRIRRSEQIREEELRPIPEEEMKDVELSVDHEHTPIYKFPDPEELPSRKDRSGTFKPFNYIKEKEAEKQEKMLTVNPKSPQLANDNQIGIMKTIKDRIFKNEPIIDEDPSNAEYITRINNPYRDSDEEIEKKFKESFNDEEKKYFGITNKPESKAVKEVFYISEKSKENFEHQTSMSSSKFSVHESEYFGEKEFTVNTINNNIPYTMIRKTAETERVNKTSGAKGISIRKIQSNSISNGNTYEPSYDNPHANISEQQAINMMHYAEAGKRRASPISGYRPPPFYPKNDVFGNSANTKNDSPSPIRGNDGAGIHNHNAMPPNFGGVTNTPNQNQDQMNPLFTQMMMLMQQNTALMAQQQQFISGYTEKDYSRDRSRPKRNTRNRGNFSLTLFL